MKGSIRRKAADVEKSILVIRAGALGDCLLMLPTLCALRRHFPRARIDVMGYPQRWEWVLGRGLVDAVHPIERPGMHLLFCQGPEVPASLKSFLGAYDVILSYRPDPAGVFAHSLRALGAGLVLSQPPFPPPSAAKIHVADFALHLVGRLGVPPSPTPARLSLTEAELALALPFFTTHHVDPSKHAIVVMHPGSGSASKRWPVENFATLIEALAAQPRVRTVIVTGYAEADVAARLRSLIHLAEPLIAENWPMIPTAALIAQATVFVGHDSGLTHLAAALGRPTVAIFGPTDPEIWGPRGEHVTVVPMMREHDYTDRRGPRETTFQSAASDFRQILAAIQRWVAMTTPRRNPNDRLARW
jgi:ADP-heptose:LPS heptosyltransferase